MAQFGGQVRVEEGRARVRRVPGRGGVLVGWVLGVERGIEEWGGWSRCAGMRSLQHAG